MRRRVYAESEHRIPIVSKEDLQSVFLEVLDQCENHREAAKWLGIRKHTFTKLLNGAPGQKAISFNTYVNIRRALGGNAFEFAAPDDPMLEFVADEPGESDKDREQRESEAAAAAARLDRFDRCFQTDDSEIVWGNYDEWVKRETLRLERMARPVLFELWESEKYRPQLEQFLKNVRSRARVSAAWEGGQARLAGALPGRGASCCRGEHLEGRAALERTEYGPGVGHVPKPRAAARSDHARSRARRGESQEITRSIELLGVDGHRFRADLGRMDSGAGAASGSSYADETP